MYHSVHTLSDKEKKIKENKTVREFSHLTLGACCLVLAWEAMLANVRCLSTIIPSSTEHIVSLTVDEVCYDEFFHMRRYQALNLQQIQRQ